MPRVEGKNDERWYQSLKVFKHFGGDKSNLEEKIQVR